jgi:hypothetical protein
VTLTVTRANPTHRPLSVLTAFWLLMILGISALAGGIALTFGSAGSGMAPPADWLDAIPVVESWVIPGLVLGIGFGLGSLVTAYGVWRHPHWGWVSSVETLTKHHWSWIATILIGLGQVIWIGLELLFFPELSVLQAFYGPVGLALLLLPFTRSMSEHLKA